MSPRNYNLPDIAYSYDATTGVLSIKYGQGGESDEIDIVGVQQRHVERICKFITHVVISSYNVGKQSGLHDPRLIES
jgi:hypothetical protein